jgi:hypothetical protein
LSLDRVVVEETGVHERAGPRHLRPQDDPVVQGLAERTKDGRLWRTAYDVLDTCRWRLDLKILDGQVVAETRITVAVSLTGDLQILLKPRYL